MINFALVDQVRVRRRTGLSDSGDPIYGSQSTLRARVQQGRDRGETIAHSAVVYTTDEIAVDSLVWLPGADTTTNAAAKQALRSYRTHTLDGSFMLHKTILE